MKCENVFAYCIYDVMSTQAMDHFRVSAEKLPRQVGPYPRVVRSLYDDWSRESDMEGLGEVISGEEKSEERPVLRFVQ